jgi:uncharacterized protein (TIGR02284 family)
MQTTTHTAEKLNSLLKGEISAVETYRRALEKIADQQLRAELEKCYRSHFGRVDRLSQTISDIGAVPVNTSGAWGTFAKIMEEGAKAFGDKAVIAVLEEGEDHGLKDYRKLEEEPDLVIQNTVRELLPKQEETHECMSTLKHNLP